MEVALLTVGDELLAGETTNTNASWLAERLTDRGASVRRVLTVPDERDVVADAVRELAAAYDAVVVTGGVGGTPDDVTVAAVADGLDRDLVVFDDQRRRMVAEARAFAAENPDLADDYDFEVDFDAAASLPAGAEPVVYDGAWAPGCVVANVYVLPGVPEEMRGAFETVAGDFGGDRVSETLYTPTPEGALGDVLKGVREHFDVSVGSHPGRGDDPGRIRVAGTDADVVAEAAEWVRERVETVEVSGTADRDGPGE